jgi:hypothetical protein
VGDDLVDEPEPVRLPSKKGSPNSGDVEVLHLPLKTGSRFSISLALIPSFRSSV